MNLKCSARMHTQKQMKYVANATLLWCKSLLASCDVSLGLAELGFLTYTKNIHYTRCVFNKPSFIN